MQAVKCAWEREDGGDLRMGRSRAMQYHVGPCGNVWGSAILFHSGHCNWVHRVRRSCC